MANAIVCLRISDFKSRISNPNELERPASCGPNARGPGCGPNVRAPPPNPRTSDGASSRANAKRGQARALPQRTRTKNGARYRI